MAMSPMMILIAESTLLMVSLMTLLWWIHFPIKNAGILDFGWALGLALVAILYVGKGTGYAPRRLLIGSMAAIWGIRLALHILFDRVIGKPEDPRYRAIRAQWQGHIEVKLFLFFQLQALLDVFLAMPFLLMAMNPDPSLRPLEWLGFGLWVVSVGGESVADSQLKRFKANPANKGKTCRSGLWGLSRHPNYFFEWLVWVAYFLAALPSPHGWIAVASPLLMFYFLFKVTGIPLTEAQALKTRGDDYREYQQTTSVFVPWFKKV